jgi:U3 small nucleolar RNA-associated protein 12
VWSLDINPSESKLIVGASDENISVWSLNTDEEAQHGEKTEEQYARFLGTIQRTSSTERVVRIRYSKSGDFVGIQSADHILEIWQINTPELMEKKQRKRMRKEKKKSAAAGDTNGETIVTTYLATDEFTQKRAIYTSSKLRSFTFRETKKGFIHILCSLSNNSVELYQMDEETCSKINGLEMAGHRSDIRAVCLSSDNSLLMSIANSIYNLSSIFFVTLQFLFFYRFNEDLECENSKLPPNIGDWVWIMWGIYSWKQTCGCGIQNRRSTTI